MRTFQCQSEGAGGDEAAMMLRVAASDGELDLRREATHGSKAANFTRWRINTMTVRTRRSDIIWKGNVEGEINDEG